MLSNLRPALVMIVLFTLVTGLAYPLVVTGIAQGLMRAQANGDLATDAKGAVVGSRLIAQGFAKPQYLHPRPSAAGAGYDPTQSGGSNYGPMDPKLAQRVAGDAKTLAAASAGATIPADAVTTSGSGLDPDISPENAALQAARIAAARGESVATVTAVIAAHTRGRTLGVFGEPRVNVLEVNLALDGALSPRLW